MSLIADASNQQRLATGSGPFSAEEITTAGNLASTDAREPAGAARSASASNTGFTRNSPLMAHSHRRRVLAHRPDRSGRRPDQGPRQQQVRRPGGREELRNSLEPRLRITEGAALRPGHESRPTPPAGRASAACSARRHPRRPCRDCPGERPAPPDGTCRWRRHRARACWSR